MQLALSTLLGKYINYILFESSFWELIHKSKVFYIVCNWLYFKSGNKLMLFCVYEYCVVNLCTIWPELLLSFMIWDFLLRKWNSSLYLCLFCFWKTGTLTNKYNLRMTYNPFSHYWIIRELDSETRSIIICLKNILHEMWIINISHNVHYVHIYMEYTEK